MSISKIFSALCLFAFITVLAGCVDPTTPTGGVGVVVMTETQAQEEPASTDVTSTPIPGEVEIGSGPITPEAAPPQEKTGSGPIPDPEPGKARIYFAVEPAYAGPDRKEVTVTVANYTGEDIVFRPAFSMIVKGTAVKRLDFSQGGQQLASRDRTVDEGSYYYFKLSETVEVANGTKFTGTLTVYTTNDHDSPGALQVGLNPENLDIVSNGTPLSMNKTPKERKFTGFF